MRMTLQPDRVLCPALIGLGARLDPFIEHPMGLDRWERLWRRIDLMGLPLVRTIVPVSAFAPGGRVSFGTPQMAELYRLLDAAQVRDMAVIWGIDGEGIDFDGKGDPELHEAFAEAAAHLCSRYGCIRYLSFIDQPEHGRSLGAGSAGGNYALWSDAIAHLRRLIAGHGIRAGLLGPNNGGGDWHERAIEDTLLDACAVMAAPRDALVSEGRFAPWRDATMRSSGTSSAGNGQRGAPPRLLSSCSISDDVADDDRQWHARKPWYATAVADLAAQALRAGVSGVIYRALDDAIQPRSLWGLWDSTGAYDRDGEPRPIARAWTILSRCFPPGARTVDVAHEARSGFRAVGALVGRDADRLNDWSVLLINRRTEPLDLLLQFPSPVTGLCRYDCFEDVCPTDYEGFPVPAATGLTTDSAGRLSLRLPSAGMAVVTTISS